MNNFKKVKTGQELLDHLSSMSKEELQAIVWGVVRDAS